MFAVLTLALLTLQPPHASSQAPQPSVPPITEHVEVVATRIPEVPIDVPAAVEVLSGEDLRTRGATDLANADEDNQHLAAKKCLDASWLKKRYLLGVAQLAVWLVLDE